MTRYLFGPVAAIVLSVILLAALFMLSAAAQHSPAFADHYLILLVVNVLGIIALLGLIGANVWQLVQQFHSGVLGSRLTVRFLTTFALLGVVPLGIVYYFSVQFLNKGIDSWFDVRIEQALDDALLLGRTSLEAIKQDLVEQVLDDASRLAEVQSDFEVIQLLDDLREQGGYYEMTLYTQNGRIIASSNLEARSLIPDTPAEGILASLRQEQLHATLEPLADGGLQLRVAVAIYSRNLKEPLRVLQVLQPLTLRYANLGESIQSARAEYERLLYLREPLKYSFVLTLTLITLITTLFAFWLAIFLSRRLVAPLRELAAGTRAVAAGNYSKQLSVTSTDELGVLVQSFNDMTVEINRAQNEARASHREAEEQRTYLETVLGHLSSGVVSFDHTLRLRTQNAAAGQILEVDLAAAQGQNIAELSAHYPWARPFLTVIEEAMSHDLSEWQSEANLLGRRGRQVLICRGTRLPGDDPALSGHVVVFDDVTDLIQAQRDAAWGEVARRLAHEIKNPLTPIQLSAERIRHKYLHKLGEEEGAALDRATRTIAQQVESMKLMVNAFSSYAQPVQMRTEQVNLNRLIADVLELHKYPSLNIRLDLAPDLPMITADPDRLRQVLHNLVINTRDAVSTVADSEICIATRHRTEDALVALSVRDNGPGFPRDILERVFEPYVTTKEKGTGLGLAIVKRIVEEHGGTLWVENPSEGGALVTIHLPIRASSKAGVNDVPPRTPRLRAQG